jgi:hypothetical protein
MQPSFCGLLEIHLNSPPMKKTGYERETSVRVAGDGGKSQ